MQGLGFRGLGFRGLGFRVMRGALNDDRKLLHGFSLQKKAGTPKP